MTTVATKMWINDVCGTIRREQNRDISFILIDSLHPRPKMGTVTRLSRVQRPYVLLADRAFLHGCAGKQALMRIATLIGLYASEGHETRSLVKVVYLLQKLGNFVNYIAHIL